MRCYNIDSIQHNVELMSKKSKKGGKQRAKNVTLRHTTLYCMDCGVLIDSELAEHIEMTKEDTKKFIITSVVSISQSYMHHRILPTAKK